MCTESVANRRTDRQTDKTDRHTSLVRFSTHVGLTQAHSNYLHILNLEPGIDQSYMVGRNVFVCVWEVEVSCYKVHSCINVHGGGGGE